MMISVSTVGKQIRIQDTDCFVDWEYKFRRWFENILYFSSINSFDFKFQEMDFEENLAFKFQYDDGSTEASS